MSEKKVCDWIPCSDKLPDVGQDVLLWMRGGYAAIGSLRPYDMWNIDLFDYDFEGVSHWMPLPEKPKEE